MNRITLAAAAAFALAATAATAGEIPAQGPMSPAQLQLSASVGQDFCLTCQGEEPKNGRYTCWDATGLELAIRVAGDVKCAARHGNPMYTIGNGKCATKKYCHTIE